MSTTVNVAINDGLISTGEKSLNKLVIHQYQDNINWEKLNQEINTLKSSPDASIQKFANEAAEAAKKKDKQGICNVLSKWIPCIADLISSSYYLIEIAKNFKIW